MADPWDDMYQVNPGFGKRRFSKAEINDIMIAVIALSFAFFILLTMRYGNLFSTDDVMNAIATFGVALILVATSFMLHEFAHKFVAQRYGAWAEFRAYIPGLFMSLVFSFIGFLMAAPGAVYIQGRIDKRMNGHISLAGPLVNLIIAGICMMIWMFVDLGVVIGNVVFLMMYFNTFLGFFNLLPIPPLDGSKILSWNVWIYGAMLIIALVMLLKCWNVF